MSQPTLLPSDKAQALTLADAAQVSASGIVSRTLLKSPELRVDPTRFDVRAIPCRIKHARIFQRWSDLSVGQHFVLVNDHDPVPLRYQFEAEFPTAFSWEYLERGPDEFQVKITRLAPCGNHGQARPATDAGILQVDARGLEPPEPLVRILEALESLPAGVALRALTDREPCHLFGEVRQLGFRHESQAQADGSWITRLERA